MTRYPSAAAHKLLTDNRDRYIAQSRATRDGHVPRIQDTPKHNTHDWPHGRRQRYASEQVADHPSAEEVMAAGSWKYEGSPHAA